MGRFDLSGIIEQDPQAVQKWISDSLIFAHLSVGEQPEKQIIVEESKEIINSITGDINAGTITPRIVEHGLNILGRDYQSDRDYSRATKDDLLILNYWIMRSLSMLHITLRIPFQYEQLEAEAGSKVIAVVQGNRTWANRADLDCLVRRTFEYCGESLGILTPV